MLKRRKAEIIFFRHLVAHSVSTLDFFFVFKLLHYSGSYNVYSKIGQNLRTLIIGLATFGLQDGSDTTRKGF